MGIARLNKFLVDVRNVSFLPDSPISTELTADELKALFDKGSIDLKAYINSTLYDEMNVVCDAIDSLVVQTIPDGSVTTVKLDDGAVTTDKLDSQAVTTAKIAESNVTTNRLADNCITSDKILNGAVTNSKIDSVAAGKITGTLSTAHGGFTYAYWKTKLASDSSDFKARYIKISSTAPTSADSATDGSVWLQLID